jgi:hypothetical protein
MRLQNKISALQEELLRKNSVLRRYEQEQEKSKAERETTLKKMQDMELENESLKLEITYTKHLLRHTEEDLKCIPILKAELDESKQMVQRLTMEGEKRKAAIQIIVKKIQRVELEIKSMTYVKGEKCRLESELASKEKKIKELSDAVGYVNQYREECKELYDTIKNIRNNLKFDYEETGPQGLEQQVYGKQDFKPVPENDNDTAIGSEECKDLYDGNKENRNNFEFHDEETGPQGLEQPVYGKQDCKSVPANNNSAAVGSEGLRCPPAVHPHARSER